MSTHSFNLLFRSAIALLGLSAVVLWLQPLAGQSRAKGPKDEIHVLFIGNSFTFYNDLPRMIAELAKAGGQRPLSFRCETPGGCTLEKHWHDGKAQAAIRSRPWDFVVLQDQSQTPLLRRAAMFEFAKKFAAEIKSQRSQTILYETWAMQSKPEQQAKINAAYEQLSHELPARLAPVGGAWQAALTSDKNLILHDKDQIHPNAAGTYLAACVFYATIYGQNPAGLPGRIGGLTDNEAQPLQVIAWKAVQAATE